MAGMMGGFVSYIIIHNTHRIFEHITTYSLTLNWISVPSSPMKILINPTVAALLSFSVAEGAFVPTSSHRASLQATPKISLRPSGAASKSRSSSNSIGLRMAAYPVIDEWVIAGAGGIKGTIIESPIAEMEVGEIITTSKIVTNRDSIVDGTIVETASGSRYVLGTKKGTGARFGKIVQKPAPPLPTATPTIDNWELTSAGEINGAVTNYTGNVFEEGEEITTSPLSNKRGIKDGSIVTTISGSKYKLGTKKTVQVFQGTKPIVNKPEPVVEEVSPVPAPSPVPAKPAFSGFNFFSNKEKDDMIEEIKEVADIPQKVEKKRPAPFGSVGRGAKKGTGRDIPPLEEAVPVIDNWFVNKREQVIGNVSNSPYVNEKDGKKIVTSEVATNMAFVEEGFTVLTMNDRKYKLGSPKGGSKKEYDDEMASYVTPTLLDWDVDATLKITGSIKESGNRNVPDGASITTDQVISDFEFIAEGFTVCTESGRMYKLGNRNKGRKPVANSPSLPPVSLPKVSVPKASVPQASQAGGTMTASGKVAEVAKKAPSKPLFNFGGKAGKAANKPKKATPKKTSAPSVIPTLEEWTVNRNNEITGVVINSFDRDGETLTTSAILKRGGLRDGSTVYTKSGSAYILGTRKAAAAAFGRTNTQTEALALPILNDWAVTAVGGLSGIVTNCLDPDVEDGEILTTSKVEDSVEFLAAGDTVVTVNGSKYVLGSQRPLGVQVQSPETPVLAGIWVIAVLIFVALTD